MGQVMATGESITVADAEAELRPEGEQSLRRPGARRGCRSRAWRRHPLVHAHPHPAGDRRKCTAGQRECAERLAVRSARRGVRRLLHLLRRARLPSAAASSGSSQPWRSAERWRCKMPHTLPKNSVARSSSGSSARWAVAASILDIDELLNEIVRLIQQAFGYDHVGLARSRRRLPGHLPGTKRSTGWAPASCGMTRNLRLAPYRLKVGSEGINGWVAGSGEPLLAPDVSREPRAMSGCAGTARGRSWPCRSRWRARSSACSMHRASV